LQNEVIKLHGDPTINHHDWVVVKHNGNEVLCHMLCVITIMDVPTCTTFPVGSWTGPGQYVICHFIDQNIFSNNKPDAFMYGHGDFISYCTDENCSLV